jgi:hypothetical protein
MLKVHGRANSINVRKVLWFVDEIGLPYAREDWGRGFGSTDRPSCSILKSLHRSASFCTSSRPMPANKEYCPHRQAQSRLHGM